MEKSMHSKSTSTRGEKSGSTDFSLLLTRAVAVIGLSACGVALVLALYRNIPGWIESALNTFF